MKKQFRIGKLLFLSAASDGDVVSIYRNNVEMPTLPRHSP